jgi:hypothetical protein
MNDRDSSLYSLLFLCFVFCGLVFQGFFLESIYANSSFDELEKSFSEGFGDLDKKIEISREKTHETLFGFQFNKNLKVGDKGGDVKNLQKILNTHFITLVAPDGPGSPGYETDYFGLKTKDAVIRFQDAYASEVLIPSGLYGGTGFVGFYTRKKLNELIEGGSVVGILRTPLIETISPEEGSLETKITITGKWFSEKNTVLTTFQVFKDVLSHDGTTLEITLNDVFYEGKSISDDKTKKDTFFNFVKNFISEKKYSNLTEAITESKDESGNTKIPESLAKTPVYIFVLNKNGTSNSKIFALDIDFTKNIRNKPEGEKITSCSLFCEMKKKASASWEQLTKSLVSDMPTTKKYDTIIPFKGQVLFSLPCFCNESFAIAIRPESGPSGIYQVPLSSLKKFWLPVPPQWIVGTAKNEKGMCSIWLIWCFSFETDYIVPSSPGVGTSSFVPKD